MDGMTNESETFQQAATKLAALKTTPERNALAAAELRTLTCLRDLAFAAHRADQERAKINGVPEEMFAAAQAHRTASEQLGDAIESHCKAIVAVGLQEGEL